MHLILVRLLPRLGLGITGVFLLLIAGQIILRIKHGRKPGPMSTRWAHVLYSPKRGKLFGTPERIIEDAKVDPGMRVLEIGPGPGNFTLALARKVGKNGSITCLEIQPAMIDLLRQRVKKAQVSNVEIVQGDAQQIPFPPKSFDALFMATVIGEVPDVRALFRECERVLKPGGVLSVTEQITDPDFRLPRFSRKLASLVGLADEGYTGLPWWIYTARYRKSALHSAVA